MNEPAYQGSTHINLIMRETWCHEIKPSCLQGLILNFVKCYCKTVSHWKLKTLNRSQCEYQFFLTVDHFPESFLSPKNSDRSTGLFYIKSFTSPKTPLFFTFSGDFWYNLGHPFVRWEAFSYSIVNTLSLFICSECAVLNLYWHLATSNELMSERPIPGKVIFIDFHSSGCSSLAT